MKTALGIFKRDVKRLKTNIIAVIVLLGICILPSLYAWFNIAAVWDPYGNTGGIPVAVVNEDKGSSLEGINVNAGEKIVTNLKGNHQMGWKFVDKDKAMDGIKEGDYYAVVYIPKDFSEDMISVATGTITRPEITYYVNEKKNGIAPKITDKGVEAIQTQVNSSFIGTVTGYMTDILKVGEEKASVTKDDLVAGINKTLDNASADLSALSSGISSYQSTIDSAVSLIDANITLAGSVDDSLSGAENRIEGDLSKLKEQHAAIDADKFPDIDKLLTKVENGFDKCLDDLKQAGSMSSDAQDVLTSLKSSLNSVSDSLTSTKSAVDGSIERIDTFRNNEDSLNISDGFVDIINKIISNPKSVSEFMASPVKISTEKVYPVADYGSAMAPFYTTLAIWVGGIIMVAIMKTRVREDDQLRNITPRAAYIGRSLIFIITGLVQALIIGLGNIFFLGMQCKSPLLFMVTCLITSFVFTLIIYTLTVSFGSIGKALCVIWLVLQVAGSGGTYPIEVLPQSFQYMSHFMPFTFACDAMRETVAGVYTPDYITDMLKLLCFVPLSLLLGLVLRNPLRRLNEFFEDRLEDTKFMG